MSRQPVDSRTEDVTRSALQAENGTPARRRPEFHAWRLLSTACRDPKTVSPAASSVPSGKRRDTRCGNWGRVTNPATSRSAGSARHTRADVRSANRSVVPSADGRSTAGLPRKCRDRVNWLRTEMTWPSGVPVVPEQQTCLPPPSGKPYKLLGICTYFNSEAQCRTANRLTTGQPLGRPTTRRVWRPRGVRLSGDR